MPRTTVVSRIPGVSRVVVMMAVALLAISALIGLPDGRQVSGASYSTVAVVSDTAPSTPVSTAKCKKRCKKRYNVRDSDLRNLSEGDLESVATLGTVLAVIALAAVI
jgi:hypothetical protein